MPAKPSSRTYGRSSRRPTQKLVVELPQSPLRKTPTINKIDDEYHAKVQYLERGLSSVQILEEQSTLRRSPVRKTTTINKIDDECYVKVQDLEKGLSSIQITEEEPTVRRSPRKSIKPVRLNEISQETKPEPENKAQRRSSQNQTQKRGEGHSNTDDLVEESRNEQPEAAREPTNGEVTQAAEEESELILSWEEVCPAGDEITKIAEASYAEIYRISNALGVSIIKVMRLPSSIKPKTKQQVNARLVDEEPHAEEDIQGELQISEWLADIPGFVVYKDRYQVKGKATRRLLETHQTYQKKMKRQDPGRAQFYPSPSRYLDETLFMVVELGDAGKALEDWKLTTPGQLWDIFFLEAIALARAEDLVMFEHRDLHEGNICLRQVTEPTERPRDAGEFFGFSGLEITILDYGLSRAEDLNDENAKPVAYDLERDLSLFTSTHAPQCEVYRRMRSFMLRADRECLPPDAHTEPYPRGIDGTLSWDAWEPYTNVLWLAYMYEYLTSHFKGDKRELQAFQEQTKELWTHLDPKADPNVPSFSCSGDVVCFGIEAGWLSESQLMDHGCSILEDEGKSILVSRDDAPE